MRTVGEVAALAGVTVRTLHHYEELGLLSPTGRSDAGYRLYSHEDLDRLQEILVWRALGFPLAEIQAMLDDPAYDRLGGLVRQRELVGRELVRLGALHSALDAALAAQRNGMRQPEATMFDGFDPTEYEDDTRERWGHTEQYRESARRTAAYGKEKWQSIRSEADAIARDFAALQAADEPAGGERACAVAERHRRHISRFFYECTPAMHRSLGEMYVSDERFARNYDTVAPGLAAYVRDAVAANADALEASMP